jgi:uncharacterized protein (DUF2062 family)
MTFISKKLIRKKYLQMMRYRGSPESVGRGAAIGLLFAFAIPFSFQMAIAFPVALLFKAAKLPAMLFTWVSNPITIPILYPLQCFVGGYLIGHPLTYATIRAASADIAETPKFGKLVSLGGELILSFLAGGLLFGTVSAVIGYFVVVALVQGHRERSEMRKARKNSGKTNKGLYHETC